MGQFCYRVKLVMNESIVYFAYLCQSKQNMMVKLRSSRWFSPFFLTCVCRSALTNVHFLAFFNDFNPAQ